MDTKSAHWVLGIFDIAAFFTCYYVYTEWNSLNELINGNAQSISVQQYFLFISLIILVPIIHVLIFFQPFQIVKNWGNRFMIFLFLIMFVGAFYLESFLQGKLQAAGYSYCNELSEQMTFSEFRVYINQDSQCKK